MTLIRQVSERLTDRGMPFIDYYLCWLYEGRLMSVRVAPSFYREKRFLNAVAVDVPVGESFEKYVS